MEVAAQVQAHRAVAEPARLDDLALGRGGLQRELESLLRAARVDDQVPVERRVTGVRIGDSELSAHPGLRPVHIDDDDIDTRDLSDQPGDGAADHARTDDRDAVAHERGGIPQHVHRCLHRAGEHCPPLGNPLRHQAHGRRRHHERGLVRVEREDRLPDQVRRPALDDADVQVPVLHGARKVAALKRCAHPITLADRHLAAKDDGLGATTDPRVHGADEHLIRPGIGDLFRPEPAPAGPFHPERGRRRHDSVLRD